MAALVKESLGKIGIKVDIQKLPDAQMSTQINEKKLPFYTEGIVAWLPSTDYFYRNFYTGNQRWNYSSINNPDLAAIAQEARFEPDKANIREALLKYLLEQELDGSDVDPDAYLAEELMPYLVKQSGNWKDLANDIMWKDSQAHKHLLEYLKNQLRRQGYCINKKIKEAKG